MSSFFSSLRQTAQSQIEKFGDELTLVKVSQGTYNPATGSVTETDAAPITFNAVIDSPSMKGIHITEAFSLKAGDLLLTIAHGQITGDVEADDEIQIGSVKWRVIAVDPPHSQDTVVVRTVQIRRKDS
jgi:hypothetical protein